MLDRLGRSQIEELRQLRSRVARFERDDTRRKDIEEAYRLLVDRSLQGLLLIQDQRIVFANQAAADITGYGMEELLAGTLEQVIAFVHPDDRAMVRQRHEDRLQGRPVPSRYAFRAMHKDGSVRWLDLHAGVVEYRSRPAVQIALTDVTAHKQLELALHESESKYGTLFETMDQGVVCQDADGRITSANPAAQRILGVTIEQMKTRTSLRPQWQAVREDGSDFPGHEHPALVALRTGKPVHNVRMGVFNPQRGGRVWIDVSTMPQYKPGDDRPHEVYTIFADVTERKQAEEALRESQAQLQSIFDSSPDAIVVTDMEAKTAECNRAALATLGFSSKEQVVGRSAYELIAETDRPRAVEDMAIAFRQGAIRNVQYTLLREDGTRFPSEFSASVIRGPSGQIAGFVAIVKDITKRLKAIEALEQSEQRFRAVADYTCDLEWWVGTDGRLIWLNPAVEQLTGYTVEECLAMPDFPAPILHKQDRARMLAAFGQAMAGSSGRDVEYRLVHRNGSSSWICASWQPIYGLDGTCLGHRSSHRDITDRKRAEESLRVSEERFRRVFEDSPVGMVLTRRDFGLFQANPAFCRMLGYTHEEINAMTFLDVTHPEHRDADRENVEKLWEGTIACYRTEKRYVAKSGDLRWGSLSASLVQGQEGQPLYALAIVEDITEQKQAQEQTKQRQAELLHASRLSTLGEMASGFAHELNQPLSAILSYASASRQSVQSGGPERERLLKNLDQIVSQSRRAGEIIKRVRAFAQRRTPCLGPVDIHEVVREVLALLRSDMIHKEIQVALEFCAQPPQVQADSIQLEQALLNLVRNAIEAMETTKPPERRLTIRTSTPALDTTNVTVSDTGTGVPPQAVSRIFDPFFTTKPGGLGIGLSITRSIIELHRGHLWVEPGEGRGCTFAFTLPVAPNAQETPR